MCFEKALKELQKGQVKHLTVRKHLKTNCKAKSMKAKALGGYSGADGKNRVEL